MRYTKLIPLLIIFLLFASGCQTIKDKQTMVELEQTLNAYHNTLRWGQLEYIYNFLQPDLRMQSEIPPGLENIRVTRYDVIKQPTLLSPNRAAQSVRVAYVLTDRQVERSFIDNQVWEREEGTKLWYRANPIPEFRDSRR